MTDTFIDRMKVELNELAERVAKLTAFILVTGGVFDDLAGPDQVLLKEQLRHMKNYQRTLEQRIERAEKAKDD